jgi:hypothetical protein
MYMKGLSRVRSARTGLAAHSATHSFDTAGSFPGIRPLGRVADYLPLFRAEVKSTWGCWPASPVALPLLCHIYSVYFINFIKYFLHALCCSKLNKQR